ncbi:TPA: trypsin-like peptidase domain-containing protein [Burkholderia cepacia]|nr:serine protease [Burkholderia cepacia]HDR9512226.1 trypsin-like peptidase domain-containing protein [Burkholderia cepacia]
MAWQVARQDPEKFNHSMAAGRIVNTRTGESGTAFRVGPENRLMTNAHVLNSGNARDYRVDFQDQNGITTSAYGDQLLAYSPRNHGLDYALFTVNPRQFDSIKKFGHLNINPQGAKAGEKIYIPQYSGLHNGRNEVYDQKTITIHDDTQQNPQQGQIRELYSHSTRDKLKERIQYTMDVKPGSSGSPVISADTHLVVGLNNGNNGLGGGYARNVASNMADIWQEVKGFFGRSAVDTSNDQTQRTNVPQIGDRRRDTNGALQEFWRNPSGGERWMNVWQEKSYGHGDLVVHQGQGYGYDAGTSRWVPVYDPKSQYTSNTPVSYYGNFMTAIEAHNRFNNNQHL